MSAPPYMRLYWGDYHKATRHLMAREHGAYLLLIGEAWERGGTLPDDDAKLCAWARCTPKEWAEIKSVVMDFFSLRRGKWTHARVVEELAVYETTSRKRKEAGKRGGKSSVGKDTENSQANALQLPTQSEPEPEPEPEEYISPSPTARARSFDQTEWGLKFAEAKEAAGEAADLTRPAMLHCRDLRALVEPSSGEPCDWDEVLDAIRMVAARQRTRGKLITTWAWVRDDAIALRDKRLSGNPEPQTHAPHAKPTSLADELATQKANARRRVLEMTEGRNNDQSC